MIACEQAPGLEERNKVIGREREACSQAKNMKAEKSGTVRMEDDDTEPC